MRFAHCIMFSGKVRSEADIPDALLTHRRVSLCVCKFLHFFTFVLLMLEQIVEEEVFTEKCNVSGILISQSNTILHLLEGPSSSVLRILRQLSRHAHFRDVDNRIQNGRIVYCVEDRPQRIYPDWYSSSIHEIKSFTEDVGPEACKDVVHQVATDLFEIGYKLTNESSLPEDVDLSRFVVCSVSAP